MYLSTVLLYEEGEAIGIPPIEAVRTIKLISPAPPIAPPKYVLEVFVREKDTGLPIPDAKVTILETGESKLTDEYGGTFFELEEGTYTVRVEKDGYNIVQEWVELYEHTSITVYLEKVAVPVPVPKPKPKPPIPTYLIIGIVAVASAGGIAWMARRRR